MKIARYDVPEYRWGTKDTKLGNKTLFTSVLQGSRGDVRYYSGTDAEIYFENEYIDEVVELQFTMQQNTLPLFGYNSYVYDEVATGSRLIQGQFVINFTEAGYLLRVLEALKGVSSVGKLRVSANEEGTSTEYDTQYAAADSKNDAFWKKQHRPTWDKRFDIWLSYGDQKSGEGVLSTFQVLAGVQLTGVSQQLSAEGNAVLEVYSFIAQDLLTAERPAEVGPAEQVVVEEVSGPFKITGIGYGEKPVTEFYSEKDLRLEEIPRGSTVGILEMSYESTVQVKKMMAHPILGLTNPKSPQVAFSILGASPAKKVMSDDFREDVKTYAAKPENPEDFMVEITVTYIDKDGQEVTPEPFRERAHIQGNLNVL